MKIRKTPARCTVLAAVQGYITMALTGCAAAIQVLAPPNDQVVRPNQQATESMPTIPPGHRLEKFALCYEMSRPRAAPLEAPVKRFSIEVGMLVPQDDCLAMDANGWLSVVPGQCRKIPAQTPCEEK